MKGRVLIVFVVLVMALSTLGCVCGGIDFGAVRLGGVKTVRGSGKVETEKRQVSDFTGVELATMGNLSIEVGEREELIIEAEDNLLEYIETEVRGGTLEIGTRDHITLRNKRSLHYYLTVKELDEILICGSGDVEAPDLEAERFSVTICGSGDLEMGDLEADTLKVKISGSGDMGMEDLYADALEVDITGSGDLDIAGGDIKGQDITISGSGEYRAKRLESAEAEVRITGSGSATIRVSDYLNTRISGSGDVRYVGSPSVDQTVTGSGDVDQIGD